MIRRRCLFHTIGEGSSVAPLSSAWNIKRDLNQARFLRTRPLSSSSLGDAGAAGGAGGQELSSPQNEFDIGAARRWLPPGHPLATPPARSWWSYPFMFSKWLFNRPVSDDVARSRKHPPSNDGGSSTKKKSAWNDAIRTGGVLLVLSLLWELAGAPRDALMRYTREVFYVTADVNSSDPALFEALVCWLETQQRKEETGSMPVETTGAAGSRDKERDLEKKQPAIHLFGNYFSVSEPLDAFLPEEGVGALSPSTTEPPQQPFSSAAPSNKEEGSSLYRVRHLPGLGLHRCRKDGHTLWFTRRPDEAKKRRSTIPSHQMATGSGDPEWLTITVRRTLREVVRNTWYRCTGRVLASSTSSTASCLSAKEVLDRLCEEALVAYRRTQQSKVSIYINEQGSYWELLCRKEPRDPGTLYFPEVVTRKTNTLDVDNDDGDGNDLTSRVAACTQLPPQDVSEEIGAFFRAAVSYRALGLPWRRGYLFVGPPGTGKSSLILSLAGQHHVPVYLLSLKDPMLTDSSLLRAVNSIPPRSFVVLEDLDSVLLAAAPSSSSSNPSNGMLVGATLTDRGGPLHHSMDAAGGGEGEDRGPMTTTHSPPLHQLSPSVTWSGLLNAVDGISSSEGRVLFITTNEAPSHQPHHPTASNPSRSSAEGSGGGPRDPPPPQLSGGLLRVPPALLRPGRIDSCVTFSRWTGKDLAHLQQQFQRRLLLVEKTKEDRGKSHNTTQNISSSQLSVANEKRADATDGEAGTKGNAMTSWSPAMVQSLLVKEILDLHKGTRSSSPSS